MPMPEATPEPDQVVLGPHDQPVPYTLTPQAEEELDSNAYQARVEAGLEPEAEL